MIAAASANHRQALCKSARFTGPFHVELTAPAQGIGIDVGTVVPAAVAFAVLAWLHLDRRPAALRARRGGDHQELEFVAEARQPVEILPFGTEIDLGLQRSPDLARGAQVLDALAHRLAQLAQPLP